MVMKGVGEGLWGQGITPNARVVAFGNASKSGPLELDLGLKFHPDSRSPSLTIDICGFLPFVKSKQF